MAQQVKISKNGLFNQIRELIISGITVIKRWLGVDAADTDGYELLEGEIPWTEFVETTKSEIAQLEAKYGMTSAEFYEKFRQGEMPDTLETSWWIMKYTTLRDGGAI